MTYRSLCILTFTALISACSSRPIEPTTPPPESVNAISKWETSGRVGIRTKNDAVSGNFNWQKGPKTFDLSIVGPFGQGATNLTQTTDGKVILSYEDKVITGNDPATLLQHELGWEFPVSQVTYWIRGLVAPTSAAQVTRNPDNNLPEKIEQDGWVVNYSNFTKVDGLSLPQKMQVSNPPFRVNLIINQWAVQ
ncbi:outer membrane lipoprotein LolB [Marinomonas rhizomae]|uniref:Outer-membrane lipoprotein LolB n=1 Tax=Marinomonas rhizomae TaxID=491948 RepID=A0A366J5R4_9GAMM|nr:lipoprotein insertase outer membrane protein LolB [Marinomonas rhizomae]RBP82381.1 outer membrane lipoprotein LolB [Marinomonas rhizomae]RNF73820.1 outer membrane lipoprotein LolB [Marinomonas rhizomae]